jgi:hypothetical protein
LIRLLNNGVLDKSYMINWHEYKDILLLSDGETQCKMIQIKELAY